MTSLLEMTQADKERMHACVLRILEEMGVMVENHDMLTRLEAFGAKVDFKAQIARFPRKVISDYLASNEPFDPAEDPRPHVGAGAGIFVGKYLDPETGKHVDWTEERLAAYVKVAHALPNVDGVGMLCCPLKGIPGEIHPLYSKYLNWKLGMDGVNYALHSTELLPYIEEFHAIRSEALGIPLKKSMRGGVFMVSPLKVPRPEAEQYVWCAERGYHCFLSAMISTGGSGPVTVPGTTAVHLAEGLFMNIMQRIYYNRRSLYMGCSISPLDMKRGGFCYGRPEQAIGNLFFGQMAEYYGAAFPGGGHTGLADAKVPGSEAAAQKLLTAIPSLMHFRAASISAGLLSIDEVCSPVQMVLDNEVTGALKRLIKPEPVNDETLAFDTIVEAGHGGIFTDKMHTALHFRENVWDPEMWTSELFAGWSARNAQPIEILARDKWREIMAGPDPDPAMTPEVEVKIKALMDKALKALR